MKTQKVRIELEHNKKQVLGAHVLCPLIVEVNKMNLARYPFGMYMSTKSLMECKGCRKHRGFNSVVFVDCAYQDGDGKQALIRNSQRKNR